MNRETTGTILALLTAVLSGFAIPINKTFITGLDPTVFTAVRALIIGIVFFLIASYSSKFDFKKFKKVSWSYLAAIGIIGGGFAFLLYFTGLKLTTSGRGAFLHKTLPIYVAILAYIFLKEKIPKKQSYALGVMVLGTIILYAAKIGPAALWSNPSLGDILIIGATILWAVESVIARKVMLKGETNFVVGFGRMFIGAIVLWAVMLLTGKVDVLLSLSAIQIRNLFISTAILSGYVLCWYWSIKLINVSKAAALLLLSPVISIIIGILWLGEPAPPLQLLGSALILAGAYLVTKIRSEFTTGL